MASIVNVDGEQVEIDAGEDWPDEKIDRVFLLFVARLRSDGVPVPRVHRRVTMHLATLYRRLNDMPDGPRRLAN
jgi:hypothetical protein